MAKHFMKKQDRVYIVINALILLIIFPRAAFCDVINNKTQKDTVVTLNNKANKIFNKSIKGDADTLIKPYGINLSYGYMMPLAYNSDDSFIYGVDIFYQLRSKWEILVGIKKNKNSFLIEGYTIGDLDIFKVNLNKILYKPKGYGFIGSGLELWYSDYGSQSYYKEKSYSLGINVSSGFTKQISRHTYLLIGFDGLLVRLINNRPDIFRPQPQNVDLFGIRLLLGFQIKP